MCRGVARPEWIHRKFAGIEFVDGGVRGFFFPGVILRDVPFELLLW